MIGDREAEQPARPQIDHGREVELAFPGHDLGDVTTPRHVRRCRIEVPFQHVRELERLRIRSRQRPPHRTLLALQTLVPHTFGHSVHTQLREVGTLDQLRVDTRRTVLTIVITEHRFDRIIQRPTPAHRRGRNSNGGTGRCKERSSDTVRTGDNLSDTPHGRARCDHFTGFAEIGDIKLGDRAGRGRSTDGDRISIG